MTDTHRLLLRAKALIDEALWSHIYDEDNGERPDKNCRYSQWLNDCDRFLLGEEVACADEVRNG